ncbi:DUF1858 domain-containing protein [Candidatus Microgenomates bacterium]|nr:DUF1858 domain-containing protein [Candidatus Microgenomates bacterium]
MKKTIKKSKITSRMKLGEIVTGYPQTIEIFFKYGLPCAGCHVASFETLEEGALSHGVVGEDLENLLDELNQSIEK